MPTLSTVEEIYARDVADLPVSERLRLASLILREATQFPPLVPIVDESTEWSDTEWSDEDMRELSAHSLRRFDESEALSTLNVLR